MGRIYCIIGKSSTGKDTIYKKLLRRRDLKLKTIVPYTTRPIREGEKNGVEYYFTDEAKLQKLKEEGKIIECRAYQTFYGIWNYFTVKDDQIDLECCDYLVIGTLESYLMTRNYFGKEKVEPIYIDVEDGNRLFRALKREQKQEVPRYEEMCRRFLADSQDFAKEKLEEAGINRIFYNHSLSKCMEEIVSYMKQLQ